MEKGYFLSGDMKLLSQDAGVSRYLCKSNEFENICFGLKSSFAYIWLVDIVVEDGIDDDLVGESNRFLLKYVFTNVENYKLFSIEMYCDAFNKVKSLAHLWRNSFVFEQEINELYGISFSRKYSKKFHWNVGEYPMRKDFLTKVTYPALEDSEYEFTIKSKDSLKSNLYALQVNMKESLIESCCVEGGSFHSGLEKILEGKNLQQAYSLLESYFPMKSAMWSFLLSNLLEKSHKVEISDRAKAIRMVFLELNRVSGHIKFLIDISFELSMENLYHYSLIWMKRIQSLVMSYCGNEFGAGLIRYGGVTKDISQVWLSRTANEVVWLEKSLLSACKQLLKNDHVKSFFDFNIVSKELGTSWSLTGPLVRCLGVNLDFRKTAPFYFYKDVEFEVPIGVKGSAFDLLIVRVEEVFQSFKIMAQVLDNMPTGSIVNTQSDFYIFNREGVQEFDEAVLRDSVKDYLKLPNTRALDIFEGVNGVMSMSLNYKDSCVSRLKLGSSSVVLRSLYEKSVQKRELHMAQPLWSILDINLKEAER